MPVHTFTIEDAMDRAQAVLTALGFTPYTVAADVDHVTEPGRERGLDVAAERLVAMTRRYAC